MISLVFFYLTKLLFSGFFQFEGSFVRGKKKLQNSATELLSELANSKMVKVSVRGSKVTGLIRLLKDLKLNPLTPNWPYMAS